ncbi:MAG: glycoside hydrolase family 19 protein [Erythrobacter sp.]
MITTDVFRKLLPAIGLENAQRWASAMEAARAHAGITRKREAIHWLGQMCHESGGFRIFEENLNYSAERLTKVWPKRFPTIAAATPFAGNPKALGNKVYNGRMGNRPDSDDGWYFRGRGPKQITGRDNYTAFGKWLNSHVGDPLDIRLKPELLTTSQYGSVSAAWFWDAHNINAAIAANPDEEKACQRVTEIINGGRIGFAERWTWTKRAKAAFG